MLCAGAELLNRNLRVIAGDKAERLLRHVAADVDRVDDQIHDGSQEEHGRIYYTSSEETKADQIRRSFERPVPQIFCTYQTFLFFSANASPHWTIFATFF